MYTADSSTRLSEQWCFSKPMEVGTSKVDAEACAYVLVVLLWRRQHTARSTSRVQVLEVNSHRRTTTLCHEDLLYLLRSASRCHEQGPGEEPRRQKTAEQLAMPGLYVRTGQQDHTACGHVFCKEYPDTWKKRWHQEHDPNGDMGGTSKGS